MKRHPIAFAAIVSLATLAPTVRAGADPIAFNQTPLSNAVAQLSQEYGVKIVLKGALAETPERPVTFTIGDASTTPTRLQAINALANAAGVDFQKGYVVSKVGADEAPPPVKIDSNGYVVFKDSTVSARSAIAQIASTDNATVQISSDVAGDVTLTGTTLRASEAAREIARQTHTVWRVYYALTPHSAGQSGKVVDHNNGQPIVELPYTYYGTKTRPEPVTDATQASADGTGGTNANNQTANGAVPPYSYAAPLGYAPNPYFTFGSGYGMSPFGTPYPMNSSGMGYGGFSNGGINILPGYGGYGPFGGYGGPPFTVGGGSYGY